MAGRWKYAGRIGLILVVLVFVVVGCGGGAVHGADEVEESRVESEPGEVACGRAFKLPASAEVRITGRFAESVPAGQQTVRGIVEVTSREVVRGVATPAADAFLVREGRVVTMPVAQDAVGVRWDLAAGETKSVPATASLMSCESEGAPLPPGIYELYARVMLTPDDGVTQRDFGGPWPLRVR